MFVNNLPLVEFSQCPDGQHRCYLKVIDSMNALSKHKWCSFYRLKDKQRFKLVDRHTQKVERITQNKIG